jgi:hypothetical protein
MMYDYYRNFWMGNPEIFWKGFGLALIPLVVWGLFWKGFALWRAVKNNSKPWFIVLLILNTMGILEILYIFVFGKEKKFRKR